MKFVKTKGTGSTAVGQQEGNTANVNLFFIQLFLLIITISAAVIVSPPKVILLLTVVGSLSVFMVFHVLTDEGSGKTLIAPFAWCSYAWYLFSIVLILFIGSDK